MCLMKQATKSNGYQYSRGKSLLKAHFSTWFSRALKLHREKEKRHRKYEQHDTKVQISQKCTHIFSLFLIPACSSGLIMRFYLTVNWVNLYSKTLFWLNGQVGGGFRSVAGVIYSKYSKCDTHTLTTHRMRKIKIPVFFFNSFPFIICQTWWFMSVYIFATNECTQWTVKLKKSPTDLDIFTSHPQSGWHFEC